MKASTSEIGLSKGELKGNTVSKQIEKVDHVASQSRIARLKDLLRTIKARGVKSKADGKNQPDKSETEEPYPKVEAEKPKDTLDKQSEAESPQQEQNSEGPSKNPEPTESEPQEVEDEYLYHGTNAAFEDELRPGASEHKAGGKAVYLTPSPELAHDYAYNGGGYHNENKSEQHANIYRFRLKKGTRILNLDEPLSPDVAEQVILKKYASPTSAREEAARYRRYYEGGRYPQTAEEFLSGYMDFNNVEDRQLLEQMGYKGVEVAEIGADGKMRLEVGIWDPSVMVSAIPGKVEQRTDGRLTQEASDYLKGLKKVYTKLRGRTYNDRDFADDLPMLKRMASESGISLTGEETGREIMETLETRSDASK